jgi:hypothetical protein
MEMVNLAPSSGQLLLVAMRKEVTIAGLDDQIIFPKFIGSRRVLGVENRRIDVIRHTDFYMRVELRLLPVLDCAQVHMHPKNKIK